jgi:hypothetical protein
MQRDTLPTFNDFFSLALIIGGSAALVWTLYAHVDGREIFALLVGVGIGIYADRAK